MEDNVFVVDLSAESGLELVAGKTYKVTFGDNYSTYQPTKSITATVYDPNIEPVKLSVTEAIYGPIAQPWTDSARPPSSIRAGA